MYFLYFIVSTMVSHLIYRAFFFLQTPLNIFDQTTQISSKYHVSELSSVLVPFLFLVLLSGIYCLHHIHVAKKYYFFQKTA